MPEPRAFPVDPSACGHRRAHGPFPAGWHASRAQGPWEAEDIFRRSGLLGVTSRQGDNTLIEQGCGRGVLSLVTSLLRQQATLLPRAQGAAWSELYVCGAPLWLSWESGLGGDKEGVGGGCSQEGTEGSCPAAPWQGSGSGSGINTDEGTKTGRAWKLMGRTW